MNYILICFALFGLVLSQFDGGFNGGFNGMDPNMGSGFNGMGSGFNGMSADSNGMNSGFGQPPAPQTDQPTGSPTLPAVTIGFLDLSRPTPVPLSQAVSSVPENLVSSAITPAFGTAVSNSVISSVPTANVSVDNSNDTTSPLPKIGLAVGIIAIIGVVLGMAYFLYRRRAHMQRLVFPKQFDLENQGQQMQQKPKSIDNSWRSPALPPKTQNIPPARYNLETMTGDARNPDHKIARTESFFISSFNSGLEDIEEEKDSDNESLYETKTVLVKIPKKSARVERVTLKRETIKRDSLLESLKREIEEVHRK